MFRFYSALSPQGRPDPAALSAAMEAPHEWAGVEGGSLVLRILGLDSLDVVFFWREDALFIHHPQKIFKVSAPPRLNVSFALEAWNAKEQHLGVATACLDAPQNAQPGEWIWLSRMGA